MPSSFIRTLKGFVKRFVITFRMKGDTVVRTATDIHADADDDDDDDNDYDQNLM